MKLFCGVAVLAGLAVPAGAADLTLAVTGAGAAGQVWIQVFDDAAAFAERKNPVAALILPPGKEATLWALPAGRYAVAAFQDGNGNGRLDANLFGQPVEPYGFSHGAGPGDFAAAAVEAGDGASRIVVDLR
jgi:Uncharacterized protein conserved in bacteria